MNRNRFAGTIDIEFELDGPRRPRAGEKRAAPVPEGSTPRLTRLMALSIKCLGMVERNEVLDYAELARVGYVTRARMSQIMNLVNLAPDIQEEILFLPKVFTHAACFLCGLAKCIFGIGRRQSRV